MVEEDRLDSYLKERNAGQEGETQNMNFSCVCEFWTSDKLDMCVIY